MPGSLLSYWDHGHKSLSSLDINGNQHLTARKVILSNELKYSCMYYNHIYVVHTPTRKENYIWPMIFWTFYLHLYMHTAIYKSVYEVFCTCSVSVDISKKLLLSALEIILLYADTHLLLYVYILVQHVKSTRKLDSHFLADLFSPY